MFFKKLKLKYSEADKLIILGELIKERASKVATEYKQDPSDINKVCAELMLGVMDDYATAVNVEQRVS